MDLEQICKKTTDLARRVGAYIRQERQDFSITAVEYKGKNDFVSHVDKSAELKLVEELSEIIPECGFITEEGTASDREKEYVWVIDPLDGTTNFIHGAPPFSISIGLLRGNDLIMGVVYEITADECFYAFENSPAYCNGEEIRVSGTQKVEHALIATGFPYSAYDRLDPFMETLDYLFHHSHGVRRLGSAAVDLSYVACGRYDGFYEYNLKPWDVAGGIFILKQAGGNMTDFTGGDNYLFGRELVASNSHIQAEFQKIIGDIMNK